MAPLVVEYRIVDTIQLTLGATTAIQHAPRSFVADACTIPSPRLPLLTGNKYSGNVPAHENFAAATNRI